jgi:amino acid transporter
MHLTVFDVVADAIGITFVLSFFFSDAYRAKISETHQEPLRFPQSPLVLRLGFALLALLTCQTIQSLRSHPTRVFDWISALFLAFISLLVVLQFPGAILVTEEGIEQSHWIRGVVKRIRWSEIEDVITESNNPRVSVIAENGTTITHDRTHLDRERFMLELKRHCGEELLPKE